MRVISAKIPDELKKKLDEYGINVSEAVRRTLEQEVLALEGAKLKKRLKVICPALKGKVTEGDVVRAVRESRRER